MSQTVCLFDIDGTLLNTGGAGQRAMELALLALFGHQGPYENIPTAGRTDRAITTDLFRCHGVEADDAIWNEFIPAYLTHLRDVLAELEGMVLPGIVALLDHLTDRNDVVLGLLTGNFQQAAWIKLEHYGLHPHFAFGGFGDDHVSRDDVARIAFSEAERFLRRSVDVDRVVVIGDTPSDVTCARAIHARAIAVSTGIYKEAELAAAKPDHLVPDLSDLRIVISMIGV